MDTSNQNLFVKLQKFSVEGKSEKLGEKLTFYTELQFMVLKKCLIKFHVNVIFEAKRNTLLFLRIIVSSHDKISSKRFIANSRISL